MVASSADLRCRRRHPPHFGLQRCTSHTSPPKRATVRRASRKRNLGRKRGQAGQPPTFYELQQTATDPRDLDEMEAIQARTLWRYAARAIVCAICACRCRRASRAARPRRPPEAPAQSVCGCACVSAAVRRCGPVQSRRRRGPVQSRRRRGPVQSRRRCGSVGPTEALLRRCSKRRSSRARSTCKRRACGPSSARPRRSRTGKTSSARISRLNWQ